MDQKGFLNKQVSEIVGISPRQVLAWTEKGLVVPFKESTGVGTKRIYNRTNLLEFGLCDTLLLIGIGFRAVKKISGELRRRGLMESWAEDFSSFYESVLQNQDAALKQSLKFINIDNPNQIQEGFLKVPLKPPEPVGILVYFFTGEEGESVNIIPWGMEHVINLNIIKKAFIQSAGCILIDLGKIKKRIDRKL